MAAQVNRSARLAGVLAVVAMVGLTACTDRAADKEYGLSREGQLSICVPVPTPMYAQTGGDQQVSGLDPDVLALVAKKIGLSAHYEVIPADWIGTDKPFDEAKCEVVAGGQIIDAATRDVLDYTIPYLRTTAAMMVRSDSDVKKPEDLKGKAVATPGERPWAGVISTYSSDWGVTQSVQPDMVAALAALDAGDAPAVLADDASLRYLVANSGGRYRMVEGVDKPAFPVALATSVFIETDLRDALNGAIKDLAEDGSLARLQKTWTGV